MKMVLDPLSYSMTATIGVQYLVLLPLLAVRKWRAPRNRFLLSWLILAFLAWYLNFRTARYAMPILLLVSLWPATALAGATGDKTVSTRFLNAAVVFALAVNAGVFLGVQGFVNRSVGAAFGMISSSRYLMETYEVYPAIDYLNGTDPSPGRVLFVGEMRGFYAEFPREVPSHNMPNRLLEMVKGEVPNRIMVRKLADAGFTHLLVNTSEWSRMAYRNRNAPAWRLSESQMARFEEFLRTGTDTVFAGGPVTVYHLAAGGVPGGN